MADIAIGGRLNCSVKSASVDLKYGPYPSKQAAFETLGEDGMDALAVGLTVGIEEDGKVVEYWFESACESVDDLVKKIDGGGSDVSVQQTLTSGTEIAKVSVDGSEVVLYAPSPTSVAVESIEGDKVKIATIGGVDVYAPKGTQMDADAVKSAVMEYLAENPIGAVSAENVSTNEEGVSVQDKLNELEGKVDDVVGVKAKDIDLSSLELHNGSINKDTGNWYYLSSNTVYAHKVISVMSGEIYKITFGDATTLRCWACTSYVPMTETSANAIQDWAIKDEMVEVVIPENARYLVIQVMNNRTEAIPESFSREGKDGIILPITHNFDAEDDSHVTTPFATANYLGGKLEGINKALFGLEEKITLLKDKPDDCYRNYLFEPNDLVSGKKYGYKFASTSSGYGRLGFAKEGSTTGDYYVVQLSGTHEEEEGTFIAPDNNKYPYIVWYAYFREKIIQIYDIEESKGSLQKQIDDLSEKGVDKSINILFMGNSYSANSVFYAPFILKNIAPNLKFKIGMLHLDGASLAEHLANLTNEDVVDEDGVTQSPKTYNYYYWITEEDTKWNRRAQQLIDVALDDCHWDVISTHQAGHSAGKDWDISYKPYIFKLHNVLCERLGYKIKFGWDMVHCASKSTYEGNKEEFMLRQANSKKVMDDTCTEILFPYGAAVENLRTIEKFRLMGDGTYHNLSVDNSHLQSGIGQLTAAYAVAYNIAKEAGIDKINILNEPTFPTTEWVEEHNATSGGFLGTGAIGVTEENCHLAQIAAIQAVKNPYVVTDISDYVVI